MNIVKGDSLMDANRSCTGVLVACTVFAVLSSGCTGRKPEVAPSPNLADSGPVAADPGAPDPVAEAAPTTRGFKETAAGKETTTSKPETASYTPCKSFRGVGVKEVASPVAPQATVRVEFASASAQLTPPGKAALKPFGEALKSPGLDPFCFRIEGHTDSVGNETRNQQLSQERAESVVTYLNEAYGITPGRFVAVGYGESKPIATNATPEGRQKNRRVQFANLGSIYTRKALPPQPVHDISDEPMDAAALQQMFIPPDPLLTP